MARAEDREATLPTEQPAHQWRFLVPQFGITLLVLYVFIRVMLTNVVVTK